MNTNNLKEYIGILADMENNIYLQGNIIQDLEKQSLSLGQSKLPSPPTEPTPFKPVSFSLDITFILILSCITILLSVGGIKSFANGRFFLPLLLLFLAFLAGIGTILLLDATLKEKDAQKSNVKKYNEELLKYQKSINEYNKLAMTEDIRLQIEMNEKMFINAEIQSAKAKLKESKKRLNEMYNLGVVFPKYRNIVMINSIFESLSSGRCSSLEGANGAYNILEQEIRLDRIISQLDDVILRLSQIRQNQYLLYTAIESGNERASQIVQSTKTLSTKLDTLQMQGRDCSRELRALQATSSVSAYNLERLNKEIHYMNRMKYLSGDYKAASYYPF